jgi:hypothetical protein
MNAPKVGDTIKVFGQREKIVAIDDSTSEHFDAVYYLENSVVTDGIEYTRDYVYLNEIQENYGILTH